MHPRTRGQPSQADEKRRLNWSRLGHRLAVGLAALLLNFPGSLCHGSPWPKEVDGVEDQSAARPEISFQFYNDNLIIVKATIGAVKNVNMILDTGTSPTAISQEMADRLKLRGETESLQTLSGTIQVQSVILPRIQIGPLGADSLRVVVQDLGFMERSLGISLGGIAGLDILSTGSFTIDYRKRKVVFGPIASSANTVPFETRIPFLTVKVKIEGQEVCLLIDSGTWGLLVYRNRLRTTREQLRIDRNALISTAGGMTQVRWLRAVVSLGKDNLGAHDVAIPDVDSDLQNGFDDLLGFAKMGFHRVSFDFENGLFGWD